MDSPPRFSIAKNSKGQWRFSYVFLFGALCMFVLLTAIDNSSEKPVCKTICKVSYYGIPEQSHEEIEGDEDFSSIKNCLAIVLQEKDTMARRKTFLYISWLVLEELKTFYFSFGEEEISEMNNLMEPEASRAREKKSGRKPEIIESKVSYSLVTQKYF